MIKKFLFALFLLSITSASAVIQTGDVLILSIKGVPVSEKGTIEGEYVVGKDGQIKVPLADVMVKARGLEHEQLARSVENAFKKAGIYSRPTITVRSNAKPTVTREIVSVGGRVRNSGPIAFRPGMTLLQAIQAAGDLDQFGTKKRIFLTRGKQAWKLDLRKKEAQQFKLKAEDTIVVDHKGAFERE
ncbi:polysaccharide biosynthesis/export family protein [Akkermansiaceae bacterium]|nr:polysaccharide biosynthesis/export family protein [Akkermansiaceae bacterium]